MVHIIARAIAPELDEKLFNLEFMPATMNRQKAAGICQRQLALAKKWQAMGLLSSEGLKAMETEGWLLGVCFLGGLLNQPMGRLSAGGS